MAKGVTLAAVGDLMFGDSPQVCGSGVASQIRRHGPSFPLRHVAERLRAADITLGNLEIVISAHDWKTTSFDRRIYRGQPESLDGLEDAGVDVVSVCTNHMMQHGQEGLDETIGLLRDRGIEIIGADCPHLDLGNASFLERDGLRFGFLAFNDQPQQYDLSPPAWPTPDLDLIREAVLGIRDQVDVVVVTLHWGDEFIDTPSPDQVELGHALIDAGVDILIGHHPHILQGVERYKGGVIAYSLGNFVYDQWQLRLRRSMILRLDVRGARDIDCELEPVLINKTHQPVPLAGAELDEARAHLELLGTRIGRFETHPEYEEERAGHYSRFRRDIYVHYLTQFWRFHPRDFFANISEIIKRRM